MISDDHLIRRGWSSAIHFRKATQALPPGVEREDRERILRELGEWIERTEERWQAEQGERGR